MRACEIIPNRKEGLTAKFFCITHGQHLLYVYLIDGLLFCRCQVGEDEHSPIQRLSVNTKRKEENKVYE